MSAPKFHRSAKLKADLVSLQLFVFSLVFLFLLKPNDAESNRNSIYQNKGDLFSVNVIKKGEKDFNVIRKLICFYIFTEQFSPKVMDGMCTHINVGFFRISDRTLKLEVTDFQVKTLTKILLLKAKSKELKIIISVGGADDTSFSLMVSNHTTRKIFIRSCIEFLKKYDTDGIDLDWEWPVAVTGNDKEKVKFVQLLQEINQEFIRHEKKYILSIDVPSVQEVIELGYLVKYIADFVDYVNVMCYDYHYFTKIFPFTGHNAPLYSSGDDLFFKSNVNYSISFWISNSMPREKIVLGMPTYGHTYQLTFANHHSLVAPAKGFGFIGQNGFADYQQICQFLKNKETTVIYDALSKTPYAYQFPEWISYDDEESLGNKVTYVQQEELAGVMIFSVNSDDYSGSCKEDNIPLPLIKRVRNILLNEV